MATEEDRKQWGKALSREDSLRVMELLAVDPTLVTLGWADDGSESPKAGDAWNERTALHVGVRRGNARLVRQVLILCYFDIPKHLWTGEEDGETAPATDRDGQPDPAEVEEAKKNDHDFASSSEEDIYERQAKWIESASSFVTRDPEGKNDTFIRRLLLAKDAVYNLDAVAIGALHGNREILLPLAYALREFKLYQTRNQTKQRNHRAKIQTRTRKQERDSRVNLRKATEKVVDSGDVRKPMTQELLQKYREHLDFNFLPWQEYFFHFLTFASSEEDYGMHKSALWDAVRSSEGSTWRFLLELRDGQGRTPCHAAGNWLLAVGDAVDILDAEARDDLYACILAARDGAGRTAFHRALATRGFRTVQLLLSISNFPSMDGNMKLSFLLRERWTHSIPGTLSLSSSGGESRDTLCLNEVSATNGFRTVRGDMEIFPDTDYSHLRTAIVHKQADRLLNASGCEGLWHVDAVCPYRWDDMGQPLPPGDDPLGLFGGGGSGPAVDEGQRAAIVANAMATECKFSWSWEEESMTVELDAVELAALVGDVDGFKLMLKDDYYSKSKPRNRLALHIAANISNYEMLEMLLHTRGCDPYAKDRRGNTALHHALNVGIIGTFQLHLLEYVDCIHVKSNDMRKESKKRLDGHNDDLSMRKGCINRLLQAGCDVFKIDNHGRPPFPEGKLRKNAEFLTWWYERQAKEFDTAQRTMASAANAISVTATLVATASYVGPLQPPMGYADDPAQMQATYPLVKMFIVCNTMSFYLAIVAITLSLLPNIPMPEQEMEGEVRRTRRMVAASVLILFPSIIFVLLAFVSSSIVVVSAHGTSTGTPLAIATASVGGLLFVLSFIVFSTRVLAFVFPRSKWVRKIYYATNF